MTDPTRPYSEIDYLVTDRVATITLSRPDRLNAFTVVMRDELIDAFDRADADDEVRAVVVTGRGRGFCAGADLAAGGDTFNADRRQRPAAETIDGVPRDGGGQVSLRVAASLKPVIAAVNGPAVGVGVTMTLPMDVRLAADTAKFGFVFARRGLVMEAASSWFLPRIVGISQAMEWVATGRVFDAAEALRGGLVAGYTRPASCCRRVRARQGDRRQHLRRRGRDLAPADVAHARRRLSLGSAPPRLPGHPPARQVPRRGRGGDRVPGEAAAPFPDAGQHGPARSRTAVARAPG